MNNMVDWMAMTVRVHRQKIEVIKSEHHQNWHMPVGMQVWWGRMSRDSSCKILMKKLFYIILMA